MEILTWDRIEPLRWVELLGDPRESMLECIKFHHLIWGSNKALELVVSAFLLQ